MTPTLKQFGELGPADFEATPVWAACQSFDYEEPWYDDTDEETFRPWTDSLPVDPAEGMFLVQATLRLSDGRTFGGFLTPSHPSEGANLCIIQPHAFIGGHARGFWGGMFGIAHEDKEAFYRVLASDAASVFPISFSVSGELATGVTSGTIAGFYRSPGLGADPVVELWPAG